MSSLRSIKGGAAPDKMREEFRKMQDNLQIILESQECVAKYLRAKYEALLAQGFTPAQALELCK
jgi:hypothetical protein